MIANNSAGGLGSAGWFFRSAWHQLGLLRRLCLSGSSASLPCLEGLEQPRAGWTSSFLLSPPLSLPYSFSLREVAPHSVVQPKLLYVAASTPRGDKWKLAGLSRARPGSCAASVQPYSTARASHRPALSGEGGGHRLEGRAASARGGEMPGPPVGLRAEHLGGGGFAGPVCCGIHQGARRRVGERSARSRGSTGGVGPSKLLSGLWL